MSDAPETIWACVSQSSKSGVSVLLGNATIPVSGWQEYTRADLATTDAQILAHPKVQALVEALERLNAACDSMWNDHDRIEKCHNTIIGAPYAIKEKHMKAISEAQQRLPSVLAALWPKP